ncbi:MAG: ribonuclease P protein subunit [Candidatus Diapherotrites archaeon]|uniref:Ribonuclease P protein component 1 n=1 Tax=Candidatus Iainarchaeum sp. TaxID=3101447 RepID=A0A7J4IS35_9ARCH|nr:MAG: ribonuclease P protein subunit POP4 [archaeon GW2011_AR10]MBS3059354.1 ribonuclease P protein subunit [Candidatus Diapherotrites archaeon]HIH08333.1 ribonuclease P protein subunit [Candidatus Diapherotrites archaeon]
MLKGNGYCISKQNILVHELIGLNVRVVGGTDASRNRLTGKVVDESKNLLVVESSNGIKKIPKKEAVFCFRLGKSSVRVDGSSICFRPEDRTRVFWRKVNG